MLRKLLISVALFGCISAPVFAEEHPVITEIKKMAVGEPAKDLTLYGLYPGMTRAEAIEVAKQADKIMTLKEDPASKSGILYRKSVPNLEVMISFYYPEEGLYTNETIRAKKIDIKRRSDERQGRIRADELKAQIMEELGEPTYFQERPKNYILTYGGRGREDESKLVEACKEQSGKNNRVYLALLTPENIEVIKHECPLIMHDFKVFHAARLGPVLNATINDGQSEAYITMTYQAESYKPLTK